MSFFFPGGVDLRQHYAVRQAQYLHKVIEQRGGAGVGVGLEGQDEPFVGQRLRGAQQRLHLVGMVGVIVIDLRAAEGALVLKAPSCAGEGRQARRYRLAGKAENIGGTGRRQGVGNIVGAGDVQGTHGRRSGR